MNAFPSVVGLGEVLWDVFCHGDGRRECRLGGAPANFAWHAAQHGLVACALSAIGQDAAGDALDSALAEAGAPARLQRVPYATGEVEIVLEGAGLPHYSIRPDAAWDHLATTPEWLYMAQQAQAASFGSLAQRSAESRAAIASFLQAMPVDSLRIFDVNLRCGFYTPVILHESLEMANILKINEEEMEVLGRLMGFRGLPQLVQARGIMARYGLSLLILTCGALGSYVLGKGGELLSYQASPRVHVVDTVGAGDSLTATFIAALLHGYAVVEAHAAAVQVASYVCTQPGAMPALPEALRLFGNRHGGKSSSPAERESGILNNAKKF